jgi:hypothetical protein
VQAVALDRLDVSPMATCPSGVYVVEVIHGPARAPSVEGSVTLVLSGR